MTLTMYCAYVSLMPFFFYYLYLFQSFDEYMKKVNDILCQKLSAIQLLQDQIIAYQLSIQDAET